MKKSAILKSYILMRYLYLKRVPILPAILMRIIRVIFSCDLPYTVEMKSSVILAHNGLGVVIHQDAVIGANTKICQNVTIGGRNGSISCPKIGENVFIGTGAVVMGDITIGDNSLIGANAVVLKSVPSNSVVGGVPAKVIRKLTSEDIVPR